MREWLIVRVWYDLIHFRCFEAFTGITSPLLAP